MKTFENIKRTGKVSKVTQGIYLYKGTNFDIVIQNQGYWAIDSASFIQKNKMTNEQVDDATYFLQYDTKRDLVFNLRTIDYWVTQSN